MRRYHTLDTLHTGTGYDLDCLWHMGSSVVLTNNGKYCKVTYSIAVMDITDEDRSLDTVVDTLVTVCKHHEPV